MLKRIPESEVMETREEAITYDEMDHRDVNETFVRDLIAAGSATGEVLDLGTGTALIPIQLCQACDDVRVFAVDLSIEMLEIARMNIELKSLIERIMLAHCDAKELDLEADRFDVVISNSMIHHIADPTATFREGVRVCRPGGLIFFRDLLRPDSMEELEELVDTYAGEESEQAKQLFHDSLQAAFTLPEIQAFVTELGFSRTSVAATSDRHWTWSAVK